MDAGPMRASTACLAVTLHQLGLAHHIGSKNGSKFAIHEVSLRPLMLEECTAAEVGRRKALCCACTGRSGIGSRHDIIAPA